MSGEVIIILLALTEGTIRFYLTIIVAIMLLWILLLFRAKRNPAKTSLDLLAEKLKEGKITEEEYEAARRKQEGS